MLTLEIVWASMRAREAKSKATYVALSLSALSVITPYTGERATMVEQACVLW